MKKEERIIREKKQQKTTQYGERFGHETGRHGSVRSKNQIDVGLRTRCVVLKQSWKSEGRFPGSLELLSWNRLHENTVLVTKRVAVAPFELNLGPNESYGRAASVGTPPGAKTAQIRAKIIVKLPIHRPWRPLCYS